MKYSTENKHKNNIEEEKEQRNLKTIFPIKIMNYCLNLIRRVNSNILMIN